MVAADDEHVIALPLVAASSSRRVLEAAVDRVVLHLDARSSHRSRCRSTPTTSISLRRRP